MKIISVSNQKGGAGKTTISRELSIYLAYIGFNVLIIDADPQGNLSKSLTDYEFNGLYEALSGSDFEIREIKENLFLLLGDRRLSVLEKNLLGEVDAHTRLKELLTQNLFKDFDFVIIDTPPSLGVLTLNALASADYLITPMNPAVYTMHGTNDLMATISKVNVNLNSKLKLLGVVINEYDSRPVIYRQIKKEIKESFGCRVFKTEIHKSIKVEEAIASLKGVIEFDDCKVRDQIFALGEEFLERTEVAVNER
jgi:chromosome partitioning protein